MAQYDTLKKSAVKRPFYYAEIDNGTQTFRFCLDRSPVPPGLDAAPFISGTPSFGAASVSVDGGIGVRGTVSLNIRDHNDETELSTPGNPVDFWPLWRARNPYYQGYTMRVYSGFLDDKFTFSTDGFQARHYLIDAFSKTQTGVTIKGRDPLKFADDDRSQYPPLSTGYLSVDIDETETSITLSDTGAGDANHGTSGIIRIGDEMMTYTRISGSDVLTIVRGQYNTTAESHSADDTVQECVELEGELDALLTTILTDGVDTDLTPYIPTAKWRGEVSTYLPGNYYAILTEPVGVKTLLTELGVEVPHRLYWDERTAEITLKAIADFPNSAPTWIDEGEILSGSISWSDELDMRISTVIVNFGLHNYAGELEEATNYRQGYIRIDPDSVTNYGSQSIKTVYSRWINNDNKAGAKRLAAIIGRRYSKAPIKISVNLDSKDSDVWTGGAAYINTRTIVDENNDRYDLPIEVLSVKEGSNFTYTCLEHSYGQALDQDEGTDEGVKVVQLSGELDQLKDTSGTVRNLREVFDSLYPTFDPDDTVRIILDEFCVAGSSDSAEPAVKTGTWSDFNNAPILDVRGLLIGKGGDGGSGSSQGLDGGVALYLEDDVQIDNTGTIGGGGGGGGGAACASPVESGVTAIAPGGGGAGYTNGEAGSGRYASGGSGVTVTEQDGTNTSGGRGASVTVTANASIASHGGDGGDLGEDGEDGEIEGGTGSAAVGGSAGAAIERNGHSITWINTGTVLGSNNA